MNSDFVTEYILKTKNFQDRYPKFVKLLEIYSAFYRKTQTSIIILDDGDSGKSIPSYGIFPVNHYPSNKSSMLEYTCFKEFKNTPLNFKLNIMCGPSCCSAMFHYALWVCILIFYKDRVDELIADDYGEVENFVDFLRDMKDFKISGPPLQSADSLFLTPANEIFKRNEFAMYAPTIKLYSWLAELNGGTDSDSDAVVDVFEKKYAVDTVIDTLRKSILHRLTSTSSSFLFPLCSCPKCKCFIMTKFIEDDKRLKLEFCDFQSDSLKFVVCSQCHIAIPKAYFIRALETTLQQLFGKSDKGAQK